MKQLDGVMVRIQPVSEKQEKKPEKDKKIVVPVNVVDDDDDDSNPLIEMLGMCICSLDISNSSSESNELSQCVLVEKDANSSLMIKDVGTAETQLCVLH